MIFVTIGTQEPFDRFIKIVDEEAANIDEPIIAQVYKSNYHAKNIKTMDLLSPDEFNKLFKEARLIIAHAGMGTILSALSQNKPILIFPRIAALGEQRNEHQLATAQKMKELHYVNVAENEEELRIMLKKTSEIKVLHKIDEFASRTLINSIKKIIEE